MPIIDMSVEALLRLVNASSSGEKMTEKGLLTRAPLMGCPIEEIVETEQYSCQICEKIADRTAAQGRPLICPQCGTDFRETEDALEYLGTNKVVRFELLAVRPDLFDPGGMARYMRGYLGIQKGLTEYGVSPARISVKVDPRLSEETSRRPYISCAVLRNVRLNHELIKMLMNLQEDLHWALGRNRKLASIGVYDLESLSGKEFRYEAIAPDGVRFVPLGFSPEDTGALMTPAEILEKHKTGQAFAHLLKGMTSYPLLRDGEGTVLSMPPIINSESTRVTLDSTDLFCDVTGLSQRSVDRALNVLVTSMKELMPGIEIEGVTIEGREGKRVSPELRAVEMVLDVSTASATIGVELDAERLSGLLERMGHGVTGEGRMLKVFVPAYRNDVMHPVDLIEDAAVAYGYENLVPSLVPTFTVGRAREIEEASAVARRIMTGLGFHQVMTLVLTSEEAALGRWRLGADPRAVVIENPISVEQTMARVSLLPGLLETLSINKQYDLPQHLFEVGDCCFCDEKSETGAREERFIAAAMIGPHTGYADVRAVTDAFMHEIGTGLKVRAIEHASFIAGRVAGLYDRSGARIGLMGEVHPEILEAYGLRHAVSVMELSLAAITGIG